MMKTRLLFIVPARLGDALMMTPALALLKKYHPEYVLDILAYSRLGASVYQGNPHCESCFPIEEIESLDQLIQQYAFIVAAHRDKKMLALIEKLNKPILLIEPADQQQAQAQQALNFIELLFSNEKTPPQPIPYQIFSKAFDKTHIETLIHSGKSYIGLHLGCHGINKVNSWLPWNIKSVHKKTWPVRKFVELAYKLKKAYPDHQIVLTGGNNEQHLAREFLKACPEAVNCIGKTSVQQLALLISYFSLYICGDTGSMHLACTSHTPLITLFGVTNATRTGPYPRTPFRRVIQAKEMDEISAEEVLSIARALLPSK